MEWKEVRLGDVCSRVCSGGTPKSTNLSYYGGEIPWLNTKEIDFNRIYSTEKTITDSGLNNSSAKWIVPNTVTVAMYGATAGKSCIVKVPMTTNQACCNLTINDEVADYEFVYYSLKNDYTTLASLANGGAQQNLNAQIIKDYVLKMPSLADQRRIASILSSLDRKIEFNNKINADLEEMAQAIFKNWFVDFEPFKDGKFVDSELGMIPEGWKVGSLGDFCNVFTGKKNTNQAIEKGLYPFFTCAPEPLASNDAIFNGKAIIIAGNGSYTGRTLFYNGGFDLYQRTYACTIREQDKENLMIFFYHMMKQFFEPTKMGGTRGSSIPYIVMGDITQQKFPYSKDWLIRFSNIANSMMDRKLRIDKENSRLSLLRDTLLPRLMSGELEVPE
ncbi:restriction endonuclease subunit S [Segatella copri]|uniref:restriction endonuclease subunit S n=1 Tax=Segatella copri TaxID=165179 RepID=UPI0018850229|nr:restriction endonuclease subunit S [Segatella copri]